MTTSGPQAAKLRPEQSWAPSPAGHFTMLRGGRGGAGRGAVGLAATSTNVLAHSRSWKAGPGGRAQPHLQRPSGVRPWHWHQQQECGQSFEQKEPARPAGEALQSPPSPHQREGPRKEPGGHRIRTEPLSSVQPGRAEHSGRTGSLPRFRRRVGGTQHKGTPAGPNTWSLCMMRISLLLSPQWRPHDPILQTGSQD